jgi:putative phosphoesterase
MPEKPFIGVVSDTHGFYDPLLDDLFAGAALIVHAGDVGAGVLPRLQRLAPVVAVLGNTDAAPALPGLQKEAVAEALGLHILVGHIREALLRGHDPEAEGVDLIIVGHSHRPRVEASGPAVLLNPGSAGRPRFGLPRTAALVFVEGGLPLPRLVSLEEGFL